MAVQGNFAQVHAALAALVVKVDRADEMVEERSAQIVATLAARLAPKLTGKMAASVDADGGQVSVDDPGGYQEYGTRHHKAQPFLRPASSLSEPIVKTTAEGIYTVATR